MAARVRFAVGDRGGRPHGQEHGKQPHHGCDQQTTWSCHGQVLPSTAGAALRGSSDNSHQSRRSHYPTLPRRFSPPGAGQDRDHLPPASRRTRQAKAGPYSAYVGLRNWVEQGYKKEKPGFWTRRASFEQVRRGSNIQLLSFALVSPDPPRLLPASACHVAALTCLTSENSDGGLAVEPDSRLTFECPCGALHRGLQQRPLHALRWSRDLALSRTSR